MLIPFPSIGGLHNVRATMERYKFIAPGETVLYRPKLKLHGENKGIVVQPNGTVLLQSRDILLDASDISGFGAWGTEHAARFARLAGDRPVAVFGEWAGPGIARKVAVCRIPERIFVVFAVQFGEFHEEDLGRSAEFVTDPDAIAAILAPVLADPPTGLHILPWADATGPVLDLHDEAGLAAAADALSADVNAVAAEDPWVKAEFGVCGPGEGLVYYPVAGVPCPGSRWAFATFAFKAKGKAHQAKKAAKPVEISPEKLAGATAFAEAFVTPARLEQALREATGGRIDTASIGPFLAWIGSDVRKESTDELAASGLEWKDVVKHVQAAAKTWYVAQIALAA